MGQKILNGTFGFLEQCRLPGSDKVAPHVIVGDEAFRLHKHILKPYTRKSARENPSEAVFNYRLFVLEELPKMISGLNSDDNDNDFNENRQQLQLDLHNNHNYDVDFIIPDCKESIGTKKAFLERHPIQPLGTNGKQMPFNPSKLYYRALPNGEKILRKSLSYSSILNKIFCASCMVFSDKTSNVSPFVNGYTIKAKHVYKAAEEHENSKTHRHAISAALQCSMSKDIGSLIDRDLTFKRMKEIEQRRLVLKRLIDIIIFIGRQGFPFRGKEEGAHSLNKKGNHGNFLELVLLLADYDSVLRVHLDHEAPGFGDLGQASRHVLRLQLRTLC
ncbi:uncharacterized protein LOC132946929 [Metopolophium dirhodum]|uniref:uncharacterized protein LOC132946929 n=1 Tax=Metopolophium dirhodum TaxID=44670 RepID=UPI00298FA37D|nr:uncharacterized protein LOC132946929 [Metopolophium dirhodum]